MKMYNKARDITYVYETTSFLDERTGKKRLKRKLIGKVDKDTGNIVPTGPKGRPASENSGRKRSAAQPVEEPEYKGLYDEAKAECRELRAELAQVKAEVAVVTDKYEKALRRIEAIRSLCTE